MAWLHAEFFRKRRLFALQLQLCLVIMPVWAETSSPKPESAGLRVKSLGKGAYEVLVITPPES